MAEQEQKKSKGIFENYIYIGNKFVSKGKYKKEELKDKEWKKYKLLFKQQMNDKYEKTFNCFSPLTANNTLQIAELQEGEMYQIGYSEQQYNHPEYGMQTQRNIFWIGTPKTPKTEQTTTDKATYKGNHVTNVNLEEYSDEIKDFIVVYKDTYPEDKRKATHFITQFMIHYKINLGLIEKLYDEFMNQIEPNKQ